MILSWRSGTWLPEWWKYISSSESPVKNNYCFIKKDIKADVFGFYCQCFYEKESRASQKVFGGPFRTTLATRPQGWDWKWSSISVACYRSSGCRHPCSYSFSVVFLGKEGTQAVWRTGEWRMNRLGHYLMGPFAQRPRSHQPKWQSSVCDVCRGGGGDSSDRMWTWRNCCDNVNSNSLCDIQLTEGWDKSMQRLRGSKLVLRNQPYSN